jgi:hypothetical protein
MGTVPCLGEHNQHVFKDFLGPSEEEYIQLLIEEVICCERRPTLLARAARLEVIANEG